MNARNGRALDHAAWFDGEPAWPRSRSASPDSNPLHEEETEIASPASGHLGGLPPREAPAWLELQARHAFEPERIASCLRSGAPPESLLERADPALPFAPASADRAGRGGERTAGSDVRAERLEALGVRVVPYPHPDYPEALRTLEDAPLVLSVRGHPEVLRAPAIAIVGARAATRAARELARRLACELAISGFTIVSGLARGIDGAAHRGALEAGGRTIGVLACGIDRIYPPEHRGLAEEMIEAGAIVSELPLGALPRPLHFPLRNRIISGLVLGVVVVEARERSGSLITVRHALAQGREVFVVPGAVDGPYATGTNQLLREGARAVRSASDVLEDLGLDASQVREKSRDPHASRDPHPASAAEAAGPVRFEERVRRLLAGGPRMRDELLRDSGLAPGALATALLELELAGRIVEERDGRIHLVGNRSSGPNRGLR